MPEINVEIERGEVMEKKTLKEAFSDESGNMQCAPAGNTESSPKVAETPKASENVQDASINDRPKRPGIIMRRGLDMSKGPYTTTRYKHYKR